MADDVGQRIGLAQDAIAPRGQVVLCLQVLDSFHIWYHCTEHGSSQVRVIDRPAKIKEISAVNMQVPVKKKRRTVVKQPAIFKVCCMSKSICFSDTLGSWQQLKPSFFVQVKALDVSRHPVVSTNGLSCSTVLTCQIQKCTAKLAPYSIITQRVVFSTVALR